MLHAANPIEGFSVDANRHAAKLAFIHIGQSCVTMQVTHCYLPPPQVPISYVFKLAVKYIVCSQYTHVCRCLCVRMCMYAFRTVCIPGR